MAARWSAAKGDGNPADIFDGAVNANDLSWKVIDN
jgi:hypothetical protein